MNIGKIKNCKAREGKFAVRNNYAYNDGIDFEINLEGNVCRQPIFYLIPGNLNLS